MVYCLLSWSEFKHPKVWNIFQGVYKIARMSLRLAEAKKVLLGLPRAIVINLYKYYTSLCLLAANYAVVVWWKVENLVCTIFPQHINFMPITGSTLLSMIALLVVQSPTLTRVHIAIWLIETSNNAWHSNAHFLMGMPCLTIIASNVEV